MSAIPLALVGAAWSMLLTRKHRCMPSMMDMIFLAGIVVKNSILLIDFIEDVREKGDGLMVSTFLTRVYAPILYSLFDELKEKAKAFLYFLKPVKAGNQID